MIKEQSSVSKSNFVTERPYRAITETHLVNLDYNLMKADIPHTLVMRKWNVTKLEDLPDSQYEEIVNWSIDIRQQVKLARIKWIEAAENKQLRAYKQMIGEKYDEGDVILPDYELRRRAYWIANHEDTPVLNSFE